jgi:hypothetical protein
LHDFKNNSSQEYQICQVFNDFDRPDEMFVKQLAGPSAALFLREVKSIIIMIQWSLLASLVSSQKFQIRQVFNNFDSPGEMFIKQLAGPSAALFLREVKSIIIMMISGGNFVPMGSH